MSIEFTAAQVGAPESAKPATESSTTEVVKEAIVPVEAGKAVDKESHRLIAFERKQKAFRQQQAQLQRDAQALAQQKAELEQFNQYRAQAKLNPIKALESLGLNYNEITNFMLNGEKPTVDAEVQNLRQEMLNYKVEQEEKQKLETRRQQERLQKQAEETVNDFKASIEDFVAKNAEKYELISTNDSQALIFDTIEAHFEQTKKVMSIEEAADLVESYIEEQFERGIKTKKFQSKLQPQEQAKNTPTQGSKTLTNQMTSAAPSMLPAHTEADRIARALAKLS